MSARVLNPAMMTEMGRSLGAAVSSGGGGANLQAGPRGQSGPSRAELARVRRDLFGPVDHAAARALAERELKAQSALDAERWGFDFRLELPRAQHPRYEWVAVTAADCIPEPYALRGMPYLRAKEPATPTKLSPRLHRASAAPAPALVEPPAAPKTLQSPSAAERTPPQEPRTTLRPDGTPDVVPKIAELSFADRSPAITTTATSTPVLARKQASITDFMKSRKRTLNGSMKGAIEPPEKVPRNAGQIRS